MIKTALALLNLLGATLLASCQSGLPPPPNGFICAHNLEQAHWVCVSIADSAAGKSNPQQTIVPDQQTNNWVGTDPQSWAAMQAWIQEVKRLAQTQCGSKP